MYTILMNADKTLSQTVRTTLLQKENMVDKLCFILPDSYNGISLVDANVVVEYTTPTNLVKAEFLVPDEELYKEHYVRYFLPLGTELTESAGDIELRLSLTKVDVETLIKYVLHTYPTSITISPLKDLYDIDVDKSFGFVDSMMLKLDAKIKALEMISGTYTDNLPYDLGVDEDNKLHLVTKAEPFTGEGVSMYVPTEDPDENPGDGVIDLDDLRVVTL